MVSVNHLFGHAKFQHLLSLFWLFLAYSANLSAQTIPGEYTPDANTVLLLHMNETSGSFVADISSLGNDGTANGTTIVSGPFGNARRIGQSENVTVPDNPSLNFGAGNFTIEALVYIISSTSEAGIVVKRPGIGFEIGLSQAKAQFAIDDGSGVSGHSINLSSLTNINDGKWHHIAGIRDDGTIILYVDGVLEGTVDASLVGSVDTSDDLRFSDAVPIIIDEVRISNIARTPAEFLLPPVINYRDVLVGQTAIDSVSITNTTTATANFGPVTLGGADAANFSVDTTPFNLAAGESKSLQVSFTPDRDGPFRAVINISAAAGNINADLAGIGILATFTKITTGEIVTDTNNTSGSSWGDFDSDGDLDLFVAGSQNRLYENNGDGTFTRVNAIDFGSEGNSASWGDYDNDGDLDLFIAKSGGQNNALFRNNGDGSFSEITTGVVVNDGGNSFGSTWGDHDNDGDLDLFVANGGFGASENNFLYENNGDGSFAKITTGDIVNDGGVSFTGAWGEYDGNSHLDLFVANEFGNNFLYANNGDGTFTKITTGPIPTNQQSRGASWGDYDNDGDLDLFVQSFGGRNKLYANNGDGSFTEITGDIVNDASPSNGSSWGDYDNDGDLDLFISNADNQNNFLYANNGDGTFTKITTGALVNDDGNSTGTAWGDFDNDGGLDLFVANCCGQNDFLYRNDGNENHWINVKCIGTVSNSSAIGTKVRIKATIDGSPFWQFKQISGQTSGGFGAQNSLNAEFGLGDAAVIDSLIVEWPASGLVQVFTDIPADQFLTIAETDLLPAAPRSFQAEPGDRQVILSWNVNTEIDFLRYRIYGGAAPNPAALIDSVDGLTSNRKAISGLSNGQTYFFRITAVDKSLQESGFSGQTRATPVRFARLSSGEIVTEEVFSRSVSWADFDNDDDQDVFVTGENSANSLFANDGDGSFSKVTVGAPGVVAAFHQSSSWADFDNDGDIDVFVANGEGQNNFLFANNGDGTFTRITAGPVVSDGDRSRSGAWGDFERDGDVDLFVANGDSENNFLYRNNGDGTFTKIASGPVVTDGGASTHGSWGDVDGDGDLDLFVANEGNQNNFLYFNNGDGTFVRSAASGVESDGGDSQGGSWGDFDFDGDLDLFVANGGNQNNFLYTNQGDGRFTQVTAGPVVRDGGASTGSAWADFDNDGDLDLFVANLDGPNFLYANQGDGTFARLTTGALATDVGASQGAAWADFDRDGDLDLLVANGGLADAEPNFLYVSNLGAGNNWINIKCVGTASNTSAIGARVRVKATIFGEAVRQLQEISSSTGGGFGGQNSLNAEFGLGDAAAIDSLVIEWPSGIVDILTNVQPNQFLTISEDVDNLAPVVVNSIADVTLIVGGGDFTRDLEATPAVFSDGDGDVLTYAASSSIDTVAAATISGSLLAVAALAPGSATILVTASDGKGGSQSLTFGVTVGANQSPVVAHTPPVIQQDGQSFLVTATVSDDIGLAEITLNYRRGGETAFTAAAMNQTGGAIYEATVPSSFVTSRSVGYFISATDLGGVVGRLPLSGIFSVQVNVPEPGVAKGTSQPGGSEQSAYRLISTPLDLANKAPQAVLEDDLGEYDIFKWRFFEIRPDQSRVEFPNTSEMRPGKAFWLIVKETGQVVDTGAGTTNSTAQEFALPLHSKWNTVGNPFNFPIPVGKLRLASGQTVELRTYTGSWNDPVNAPVTVMQPFAGYAIFNNSTSAETLFVNPDLSTSSSVVLKELASTNLDIPSSIRILARCQEARDVDNVAAVAPGALKDWDTLDRPEPPVIGEYVSVYFPHPEWGELSKNYCTDFRSGLVDETHLGHESHLLSDGEIWEFEVKTNIQDVVHLTFEGLTEVPNEYQIWLVDPILKTSQDLRLNARYFVAASVEHPKRLQLLIGQTDFIHENIITSRSIPLDFELSQNFPNPFNPTTTIRYGLPKEERVTLTVYNILGERVATLADGELKQAGFHATVWDGRNQQGRLVASGLYLYQLRAGATSLAKKMALLR